MYNNNNIIIINNNYYNNTRITPHIDENVQYSESSITPIIIT
jgi:hypothetical protein